MQRLLTTTSPASKLTAVTLDVFTTLVAAISSHQNLLTLANGLNLLLKSIAQILTAFSVKRLPV